MPQQNEGSKERFDLSNAKADTIIISIVENRAREVCISKMNSKNTSVLEVLLIVDTHSYTEALALIEDIQPHEILLHDGLKSSVLSIKIQELFSNNISIFFISRQYFDQDKGADMLQSVLIGDVDNDLIAKYTVLAGAFCLLRYIENSSGYTFPPHSIRMDYQSGSKTRMSIDRKSVVNLELVSNRRTGNKHDSLFGVMNNTKTTVGAALLRKNLLNPCTDITTINLRLSVVESFLRCSRIYADIAALLAKFPEFERMLSGLVTKPRTITVKTARVGIDTLIYLKSTLRIAPLLAESLLNLMGVYKDIMNDEKVDGDSNGRCGDGALLISSIVDNLNDGNLQRIARSIDDLLTDSTTYTKNAYEMRHQECFAVKPSVNGYLDVARKTFLQSIEDIHEAAETHAISLGQPIKVSHNNSRGYFLAVPIEALGDGEYLPAEFIQPVLHKKTISCTTEEVSSLSDRAHESISTALVLTNNIIQDALEEIRFYISSIFLLVDSIALLDMLCSFADLVALSSDSFVRPELVYDGSLKIRGGRHLAVSRLQAFASRGEGSFVANDCTIGEDAKFVIVTGPNGSGKSTYIKTPVTIIILAQIGCFVPAIQAIIPIRDRILTRIGTGDDMEHNISTFSMEMKETAYMLNNTTERSMIIVDELGRGTSNLDGIAIAFATAEEIIRRNVMTLFVTHYTQLTTLPQLYPTARNIHLKSIIGTLSDGIQFLHQIGQGPCDIKSGYGIMMAKLSNFPDVIISEARAIQKTLRSTYPVLMLDRVVDSNRLAVVNILKNIDLMNRESSLGEEGKKRYFHDLIESYKPMKAGIITYINSCLESMRVEEVRSTVDATTTTTTVVVTDDQKESNTPEDPVCIDNTDAMMEEDVEGTLSITTPAAAAIGSETTTEKLLEREEVQENRRDGITSIVSVMEEKVKVAEREGSDMKASKSDKTYDEIMSVVQETITKAAIIPSTIEADGEKGRKRREDLNYIVNCEMASSPQLPLALNRLDDRDDLFNIASSQQLDDKDDDFLRYEDFGNRGCIHTSAPNAHQDAVDAYDNHNVDDSCKTHMATSHGGDCEGEKESKMHFSLDIPSPPPSPPSSQTLTQTKTQVDIDRGVSILQNTHGDGDGNDVAVHSDRKRFRRAAN